MSVDDERDGRSDASSGTVAGPDIVIDHDLCIGSGVCEALAEEVFQVGDDGFAEVRPGATPDYATAAAVAKACPVGAILVRPAS